MYENGLAVTLRESSRLLHVIKSREEKGNSNGEEMIEERCYLEQISL